MSAEKALAYGWSIRWENNESFDKESLLLIQQSILRHKESKNWNYNSESHIRDLRTRRTRRQPRPKSRVDQSKRFEGQIKGAKPEEIIGAFLDSQDAMKARMQAVIAAQSKRMAVASASQGPEDITPRLREQVRTQRSDIVDFHEIRTRVCFYELLNQAISSGNVWHLISFITHAQDSNFAQRFLQQFGPPEGGINTEPKQRQAQNYALFAQSAYRPKRDIEVAKFSRQSYSAAKAVKFAIDDASGYAMRLAAREELDKIQIIASGESQFENMLQYETAVFEPAFLEPPQLEPAPVINLDEFRFRQSLALGPK